MMKPQFENKKTTSFRFAAMTLVIGIVFSCDTLDVDPDINPSASTISTVYMMSGNTALIDLSAVAPSSKSASLQITSTPQNGALSSVGGGLLQYTSQGSSKTTDSFAYTVTNQNAEVVKDTIAIIIENEPSALPPGIYPTDDIVYAVTGTSPVTINPLANDVVNGYPINDFVLTIYRPDTTFPPYSGSATVSSTAIVYTPGTGFDEADKIVYKATLRSDTTVSALGLIYLTSASACTYSLTPDEYVSSEEFTQIRIPALANDQLCTASFNYSVTVSQAPSSGSVYIESDVFVYQPNNLATNGFTDSFVYQVTIDGVSKTTRVNVSVNTNLAACKIEAVNDFVDLTVSSESNVTIDVLQNDHLCEGTATIQITTFPLHGAATITTSANGSKRITYTPDGQDVNNDKIIYKIITATAESFAGIEIKRLP